MPSGPKSGKFMNRHAAEARERNEERSAKQKAEQAKAREDAMWADDDSKTSKRVSKQREAEAKIREQAERRAERLEQLAAEESELGSKAPQKVTRRQIQKDLTKMATEKDRERARQQQQQQRGVVDTEASPLPDGNPNCRAGPTGAVAEVSASGGVGSALAAVQAGLGAGAATTEDRHIGRRARVLYKQFCEAQLAALREERPGLRQSQYSDLLWKMWQKSPTNPFVQRSEMRSAERLEQERRWMEGDDDDEDDDEGNNDGNGDK